MIERKKFIKLMKEFVSLKKAEDDLNKAFKILEPEFNYLSFGRHEALITDILKEAMEDKYDWISYFIYDLDCGKKARKITDSNGKHIPLKTLNDLYNIINNKDCN